MRMKGKLVGVCVAGLVTLGACAQDEEFLEETTSEIVGGTEDPGDPAVVALYGREPGAEQGFLCTSTVIAPTVLLTAAHCVDPRVTGSSNLEYFAIFHPKLSESTEADRIKVKATHFDSAFDPNNLPGGHDIAVAILERPVTVTPLPYNRRAITAADVGQPARIVGYGVNNGFEQTGAGIKRTATTTIVSQDELLVQIGNILTTTCQGDSGGPAFMNIDGKEQVVGVTSFGLIWCIAGGFSTRVDKYLSFIDPFVEESPDPGGCTGGVEAETNNTRSTANTLCDDGRIGGYIGTGGDRDWYVFTVPPQSKYEISLSNAEKHYNLELYKTTTNPPNTAKVVFVDRSEDTYPSPDRRIAKSTQTGGTYYLKVLTVDRSFDPAVPYGVTVEITPR
jgi:V8-like Glu-specific endopeptidase